MSNAECRTELRISRKYWHYITKIYVVGFAFDITKTSLEGKFLFSVIVILGFSLNTPRNTLEYNF